MNLSELFIRRAITTTLVMLSILLFGLMAYRGLPVSDLPTVDAPTIEVSASLPGASPETMASAVATVLERQFSTIAGVEALSSVSLQGASQITLQFALDRDIDAAAQDVQSAIARAARQLPPDMPTPPSFRKVNPADQPILYLVLTSPSLPMATVNEYGDTLMAQRISMLSGVAQVQVLGPQKYAVRVQADPAALAARRIGLDEVAAAIRGANVNLPTGVLQGPYRALTIETDGQLMRAAAYRPVVVTYRNGSPVRLGDIARVEDGVENDRALAWFYTPTTEQRAVLLAVQRQPGANTVAVAAAVKALLPQFRSALPAALTVEVLIDRSLPIKDSFEDTRFTLLLTLGLVVFVIFLFLRSPMATLIPSLALPMSLIGTFVVMRLLNYSLDNLSLMALTLAIGFVVDDAIVMLENIVRHMEMGKDRWQAAFDGSREIGFTIVSMTLSLAAVFIPVLFMGGIVGRLFREFAVTIGAAVLISGFVSLTLTPMLCSRFLPAPTAGRQGWFYALTEGCHRVSLRLYDRSLAWVLVHRRMTMLFALGVLLLTGYLFAIVPKGFLSAEDRDQVVVRTEAAEGISCAAMFDHQRTLAAVVQRNPNVLRFVASAGARNEMSGNTGRMSILLKPRRERTATADEVVQELRRAMTAVPGIRAFVSNPPTIQIGSRFSKSLYQYTLAGPDPAELYQVADRVEAWLTAQPGFQDVTSDKQFRNPQVRVAIDRDRTAALGLTVQQIEDTLLSAYGTRQVSTIYAPNNQYAVILELLPAYQADLAALALLHVRAAGGRLVPLSAVTDLRESTGPLTVNHSGQLPSVTLSFNLRPGTPIGTAVAALDIAARTLVPPSVSGSFQGTAQAFQSSLRGSGWLLLLAVLVIYLVLGVLYESFWHPITILSALPFAGAGAVLALIACRLELTLYAFVGIIMLVGLVKKNGIMMIDFAIVAQRTGGKSAAEAIHEACLVRFRPIMMTTLAALMGALPIAWGLGAGGEARQPLGVAVVGGLLVSQSLTLYVTPVFYVYMERWQRVLRRLWGGRAAARVAGGGA